MKDKEGLQRDELPCEDVTFKIYKNIKLWRLQIKKKEWVAAFK